ncbi:MAG TPA: YdeI/OmpD-associated family protein [Thermoanaerobaculia bacterium]|nr:YdeI/OmpD-associated family protein [Thermoanaerobaculia bacterium]
MPLLAFPSQKEWDLWLEANHARAAGLWMKIAKKASGVATVSYDEAVDAALCWGWIDGQKGRFDDTWFLQRFTPRRPRSQWSQVNREKVAALSAAGRMREPGLRQVEAARADGRWAAAYPPQSALTVPADLQSRLDAHPTAAAFYATLDRQNRYAILYRLHAARKPETREKRLEQFVTMLAEGRKIY